MDEYNFYYLFPYDGMQVRNIILLKMLIICTAIIKCFNIFYVRRKNVDVYNIYMHNIIKYNTYIIYIMHSYGHIYYYLLLLTKMTKKKTIAGYRRIS